jgi:hypothetical protein
MSKIASPKAAVKTPAPVAAPRAKARTLAALAEATGTALPPLTPEQETASEQNKAAAAEESRKPYEDALKKAQADLKKLQGYGALATPAPLEELIAQAEELKDTPVKGLKLLGNAPALVETLESEYKQRLQQKERSQKALDEASALVKPLRKVALISLAPLEAKLKTASALIEGNQFSAALETLQDFAAACDAAKTLAGDEPTKKDECDKALAALTTSQAELIRLEGEGDLPPKTDLTFLKHALQAVEPLRKAQKFASALAVLEEAQAQADALLAEPGLLDQAGDALKAARDKVAGLFRKDPAGERAGQTKKLKEEAEKESKENKEKEKDYRKTLADAEKELGRLRDLQQNDAKLGQAVNPWALREKIRLAESQGNLGKFAAGLKHLDGYQKLVASQDDHVKKQKEALASYDKKLAELRGKLAKHADAPLLTLDPVEEMVGLAEAQAGDGNFAGAGQTLEAAAKTLEQQRKLAEQEPKEEQAAKQGLAAAQKELTRLTAEGSKGGALARRVQQARELKEAGRHASALQALTKPTDWKQDAAAEALQVGQAREFTAAEKLLAAEVGALDALKPFAEPARLQELFEVAKDRAAQGAHGEALQLLKECQALLPQVKKEAESNRAREADYLKALDGARVAQKSLTEMGARAHAAPVQKFLDEAEQFAAAGQYAKACAKLDEHQKLAVQQLDQAEDQESLKELYDARLITAMARETELKGLARSTPGPLSETIQTARAFAEQARYDEALKALAECQGIFERQKKLADAENQPAKKSAYKENLAGARKLLEALARVPRANLAPLQKLLGEAERLAGAEMFTSALEVLKGCAKAFAEEKARAEKAHDVAKTNRTYEVQYHKASRKVEKRLAKLELRPLPPDLAPRLEQLRKQVADARGKATASPPDFKAAAEALQDASKKLKDVTEKSEKAFEGVEKGDAGKVFKSLRTAAEKALAQFRELAPDDQVTPCEHELQGCLKTAVAGADPQGATAALRQVAAQLVHKTRAARLARTDYETLSDALKPALDELEHQLGPAYAAPLRDRFRKARDEAHTRNYAKASAGAKAVQAKITRTLNKADRQRAAWDKVVEGGELEKDRQRIAQYKAKPISEAQGAQAEKLLQSAEAQAKAKDYGAALATMKQVRAALKATKQRQKAARDDTFKATVKEAKTAVAALLKEVEVQQANLAALMKSEGAADNGPFLKALVEKRKQLGADWTKALPAVATPDELKAADPSDDLRELLDEAKEFLADAGKRKETAAADSKALAEQREEARLAGPRAKFEAARAKTEAALADLQNRFGPDTALAKKLKTLVDGAAQKKNYSAAEKNLQNLTVEVNAKIPELEKRQVTAAVCAREEAARALKELEGLRKDAPADLGGYFDNVKQQIEGLASLRDSGNVDTIHFAGEELNRVMMKARVAAAQAKDPLAQESLKQLKALTDKLEAALGTEALKACLPTEYDRLQKLYKERSTAAKSIAPQDALKDLGKLKEEVDQFVKKAETAQKDRDRFTKKAEELKDQLKAYAKTAPAFVARWKQQLKEAAGNAAKEKGEPEAQKVVDQLAKELDGLKKDPGKEAAELAVMERAALAAKEARKDAEKQWEARHALFKKALADASAAVKGDPEGDQGALAAVEAQADQAKQAAKGEKFDEALKQIDQAIASAQRLELEPQGAKATSRGNLGHDRELWVKAVKAFAADVRTIQAALEEAAAKDAGVDAEELGLVVKALKALLSTKHFPQGAFDKEVKILENKEAKTPTRRAMREQGLAKVRRYQKRLVKDPLLRVLFKKNNPFGKVRLHLLQAALDSLDLNIQRCI